MVVAAGKVFLPAYFLDVKWRTGFRRLRLYVHAGSHNDKDHRLPILQTVTLTASALTLLMHSLYNAGAFAYTLHSLYNPRAFAGTCLTTGRENMYVVLDKGA